jgi:hypothetical protein
MRCLLKAGRAVVAVLIVSLPALAGAAETASHRIATAANAFLSTLDENQRRKVLYEFDDDSQRARWSNFPIAMSARGGISLREMTPAQRSAAMALLSSVLSKPGFEKVQQIMEGDEVNQVNSGNRGGPPGSAGAMFGKQLYFFSILGSPSEKDPWMLQFGGHHLALNITIAGERGVLTPTLTGAQPAIFTLNGKTVRPLKGESDKAIALLNALDEKQRGQAILGYRVSDLVLGPGQDGKTIQPEGLEAASMNPQQRAMLLDLISEWSGIVHESAGAARIAEIKAVLDDAWFAWSGPTTVASGSNVTAYYRIQAPNLVIEYAPQTLGGDPALHIHTMYRDPTNDYGRKLAAK